MRGNGDPYPPHDPASTAGARSHAGRGGPRLGFINGSSSVVRPLPVAFGGGMVRFTMAFSSLFARRCGSIRGASPPSQLGGRGGPAPGARET